MKIMICASFTFAKEVVDIKVKLEQEGHEVVVNSDAKHYAENPSDKENREKERRLSAELGVMKEAFGHINESDALLILNYEKDSIKGYLGTSVLRELAVAYHLDKEIFLLNELDNSQNYSLEVALMKPIILNGDLSLIK